MSKSNRNWLKWLILLLLALVVYTLVSINRTEEPAMKDAITAEKERVSKQQNDLTEFKASGQVEKIELQSTFGYTIPVYVNLAEHKAMIDVSKLDPVLTNENYHLWSENENGSYRNIRQFGPGDKIVKFNPGEAQRFFITKQLAGDTSLPNMKELVAF